MLFYRSVNWVVEQRFFTCPTNPDIFFEWPSNLTGYTFLLQRWLRSN